MTPSTRAAASALVLLLCSASFAGARGPVPTPTARPVQPGDKVAYKIFLLARESKTPPAVADHSDPLWGLAADLKTQFERLGAKVEKTGDFTTPTADGGQRDNQVVVLSASWSKEEYDRAAALGRGVDLIQVKIEPAAEATRGQWRGNTPASEADLASERLRKQLDISIPSDMLRGAGTHFDGSTTRDAIADDFANAASRLGVTVKSLPKDPAELARLLKAQPAPPKAAPTVVPPPAPAPALKYDTIIEKVAAERGIDPDILRSLMFAAQGYSGGFSRTTGLYGPMGLSMATARDHGLTRATVEDPAANIAAAADYFKSLKTMFGNDMSRSVAAFYCGSGAVRQSRGIPSECQSFLSQYYLAYQNGAAWAIDHNAPRQHHAVVPPEPVTPVKAVVRAGREDAVAAVRGDTAPNRSWSSSRMPPALIAKVDAAASQNPFDPSVKLDPAIFQGLVWAEGGYSADNKRPNEWGAVGPAQVTFSGAEPHCKERGRNGRPFYDWKGISDWSGRKNVDCGAKVFYDRIQWTSTKDPIIGLALYNTQEKHWARIISRNKVPAFPETVTYVVRAAHIACSRTGKMLLTKDHFENQAALNIARRAERNLVRDEFPYEKISVDPACNLF